MFVLAEDDLAHAIESAVRDSGAADIEVGTFPAEAESVVTETLMISGHVPLSGGVLCRTGQRVGIMP